MHLYLYRNGMNGKGAEYLGQAIAKNEVIDPYLKKF